MKKITLLLVILLLTVNCSDRSDEQQPQVNIDYSIAPNPIKGNWKVDFYEVNELPGFIGNNTFGYYLNISQDNKVSYKDYYTGASGEIAKYQTTNDSYYLSMVSDQITISIVPSIKKVGYTEFRINYKYVQSKNNTLYAKKQ